MRVTIRQSLHPFISNKAQELGINDHAEVVNFLLLQILLSFDAVTDSGYWEPRYSVVFHRMFHETVSTVASMFQPHNNRETILSRALNMKHET
jgi:hypothetical protein